MKDHDDLRSQVKLGVTKFEKIYPGNLSIVIFRFYIIHHLCSSSLDDFSLVCLLFKLLVQSPDFSVGHTELYASALIFIKIGSYIDFPAFPFSYIIKFFLFSVYRSNSFLSVVT